MLLQSLLLIPKMTNSSWILPKMKKLSEPKSTLSPLSKSQLSPLQKYLDCWLEVLDQNICQDFFLQLVVLMIMPILQWRWQQWLWWVTMILRMLTMIIREELSLALAQLDTLALETSRWSVNVNWIINYFISNLILIWFNSCDTLSGYWLHILSNL